jgi:hypothetical protein
MGIEARLRDGSGNAEEWSGLMQGWESIGATHLTVNTMGSGFTSPAGHIEAIRRFAETVQLTPG